MFFFQDTQRIVLTGVRIPRNVKACAPETDGNREPVLSSCVAATTRLSFRLQHPGGETHPQQRRLNWPLPSLIKMLNFFTSCQ